MRISLKFLAVLLLLLISVFSRFAQASPPFNAIEGEGGIALNPVAYTANSGSDLFEKKAGDLDFAISKPQIGTWYVGLEDTNINWGSWSIAETFFKRIETSYGYEHVRTSAARIHKHNIGLKSALLNENFYNLLFLPAVSAGIILKNTSDTPRGIRSTGADYYLVATKMIPQLPRPILLSGGVLLTQGRVNGILGFDDHWDAVGFGNIDLMVFDNLAVGYEIKQGPRYGHSHWNDSNYMDVHIGFMATKKLSLIAAYVYTGDEESSHKAGLGDGFVLSAQYAF